jgi:hypothetical protein
MLCLLSECFLVLFDLFGLKVDVVNALPWLTVTCRDDVNTNTLGKEITIKRTHNTICRLCRTLSGIFDQKKMCSKIFYTFFLLMVLRGNVWSYMKRVTTLSKL